MPNPWTASVWSSLAKVNNANETLAMICSGGLANGDPPCNDSCDAPRKVPVLGPQVVRTMVVALHAQFGPRNER